MKSKAELLAEQKYPLLPGSIDDPNIFDVNLIEASKRFGFIEAYSANEEEIKEYRQLLTEIKAEVNISEQKEKITKILAKYQDR